MEEQIRLAVTGMTCSAHERRATRAITGVHGVLGAMASHRTRTVMVFYDPQQLAPALIVDRLAAAGFELADRPVPH